MLAAGLVAETKDRIVSPTPESAPLPHLDDMARRANGVMDEPPRLVTRPEREDQGDATPPRPDTPA